MVNGINRAIIRFGAIAVSTAVAAAMLNTAYAYSIYPSNETTTSNPDSLVNNFGSSINQLVTPFENFFNSVQSVQPTDVPNFDNITNRIPTTGISPSLQNIIIGAVNGLAWIIGWLKAISNWIAAWVTSIIG
jgi:hypothetical protein